MYIYGIHDVWILNLVSVLCILLTYNSHKFDLKWIRKRSTTCLMSRDHYDSGGLKYSKSLINVVNILKPSYNISIAYIVSQWLVQDYWSYYDYSNKTCHKE